MALLYGTLIFCDLLLSKPNIGDAAAQQFG